MSGADGGPYFVSFIGALANQNVATLGVNNANATVQNVSPLFFDADKPDSETVNYTVTTNHDTGLVTITPPTGFAGTFHVTVGVRGTATRTTADQFDTQDVVVTVAAAAPTSVDLSLDQRQWHEQQRQHHQCLVARFCRERRHYRGDREADEGRHGPGSRRRQ